MFPFIIIVFALGLCVGSFLNVVIYRVTTGESPLEGRSKCPKCGHKIHWYHNIPLLSFALLKGKCAYCHRKISWQYPFVEFLTGTLFVWWFIIGRAFFLLTQTPWIYLQPFFWLTVSVILLLIFFIDLIYGIIPDFLSLSLLVITFIYRALLTYTGIMNIKDFTGYIIAGVLLSLFFYSLHLITKGRGFGFGDVKLAMSLGLLQGIPKVLVGSFFSFVIGAAVGIILIAANKRKLGQTLPFGPFLVIGLAISLLWGSPIWDYYIHLRF